MQNWAIAAATLTAAMSLSAGQAIYLFSADADYARLDRVSMQISGVDHLPKLGRGSVARIVPDVLKQHVLLHTVTLDLIVGGEDWTSGLAVFQPTSDGKLGLLTTIPPPSPGLELAAANSFGPGRRLLVTWYDRKSKADLGVLLEGDDYHEVWRRPGSLPQWRVCLSSDASKLYLPLGPQDGVKILNLKTRSLETRPLRVGPVDAFSKGLGASEGCLALMWVYEQRPGLERRNGTLFLYDFEHDKVLGSMKTDIRANYFLLGRGSSVMMEKEEVAPHRLPDGTVEPRIRRPGELYLYRISTRERIGSLKVPPDGKVLGLSSDQKLAFHASGNILTIVDTASFKVAEQMELPFPIEAFAEVEEPAR